MGLQEKGLRAISLPDVTKPDHGTDEGRARIEDGMVA